MRTTLNIEDGLLERAREMTGVKEKTALVRLGLEALIALESARRLAKLGGDREEAQGCSEAPHERRMILVDTSVWVDPLRRGSAKLSASLEDGQVLCHPFVIGKLACGSLRNRAEIQALLAELAQARLATHEEAMTLVDEMQLAGSGIGWIDAHLLASTRLSGCSLWSADKALRRAAATAGVAP